MSLEDIKKKLETSISLTDEEIDEIIDNSADSSWAGVKTQFLAQVNQFQIAKLSSVIVQIEIQDHNPSLSLEEIEKIILNADGFDKILLEQGKSRPILSDQKTEILNLTATAIGATVRNLGYGPASGWTAGPPILGVTKGTEEAIRAALNKSPIPSDAQPRQLKETLIDGQIKQCILCACAYVR